MFYKYCVKTISFTSENGRRIPRGAAVLVSIHEMNLNPNHFPDPFKFDPQRFDESSSIRRPTGSFIPFSFGPRNCIGKFT